MSMSFYFTCICMHETICYLLLKSIALYKVVWVISFYVHSDTFIRTFRISLEANTCGKLSNCWTKDYLKQLTTKQRRTWLFFSMKSNLDRKNTHIYAICFIKCWFVNTQKHSTFLINHVFRPCVHSACDVRSMLLSLLLESCHTCRVPFVSIVNKIICFVEQKSEAQLQLQQTYLYSSHYFYFL